jgi:hypothetical protein
LASEYRNATLPKTFLGKRIFFSQFLFRNKYLTSNLEISYWNNIKNQILQSGLAQTAGHLQGKPVGFYPKTREQCRRHIDEVTSTGSFREASGGTGGSEKIRGPMH